MKMKKSVKQNVVISLIGIIASGSILYMIQEDTGKDIKETMNSLQVSMQTHTTGANDILQGHENTIRKQVIEGIQKDDLYATLRVDEHNFKNDLYYGDSDVQMDKGLAHYAGSGFPGQGKPILIAGHNGTEFKGIEAFEIGDTVAIDTIYGKYTYEIDYTEIISASVANANIGATLKEDGETLIMYTCYPFTVVNTPDRYFVYSHYVSGPELKEDEQ